MQQFKDGRKADLIDVTTCTVLKLFQDCLKRNLFFIAEFERAAKIRKIAGYGIFSSIRVIPHSHQKLSCLKSGVSYSSTVSVPINHK